MLRRARFVSLICFVGEGVCLSWNFTSESVLLTKFCGWPLSIRCLLNVVMVRSLQRFFFFLEEFVLRNLSLLSVGDTLLACEQALRATWAVNEVRFIFEIRFCCCVLLWSSCVRETRSLTQSLSQKPTKTWEQKNSGIGLDWRANFDQVMLLLTCLLTSLQLDYCKVEQRRAYIYHTVRLTCKPVLICLKAGTPLQGKISVLHVHVTTFPDPVCS